MQCYANGTKDNVGLFSSLEVPVGICKYTQTFNKIKSFEETYTFLIDAIFTKQITGMALTDLYRLIHYFR